LRLYSLESKGVGGELIAPSHTPPTPHKQISSRESTFHRHRRSAAPCQAGFVGKSGPEAAIVWGYEQGCFKDAAHAANTYTKMKRERAPRTAAEMRKLWIEDVERRKLEGVPQETLALA